MPTGTESADVMFGTGLADDIYGLGGNDTIYGSGGADRIYGGSGNDMLFGDLGNDEIYGGEDNDEIQGGAGDDYIIGGELPFVKPLIGFLQTNVINGGEGNDILAVTNMDWSSLNGGVGFDQIYFAVPRTMNIGLSVNLANLWVFGTGGVNGTGSVDNIERIYGDVIRATNNRDTIGVGSAYTYAVTLYGYDGNDSLGAGGQDDNIFGGIGNDDLTGYGGNDTLRGEDGDDTLNGDDGNDILAAGLGNDILNGGNGNDYLIGEGGNDTLTGGSGVNTLQGGLGDDIYVMSNRTDSTVEFAGEGIDEVRTTLSIIGLQANVENLTYTDNATHGAGVGNALDNVIRGGTGRDDLFGRDGNDTLRGGTGAANTLLGQAGDDIYVVEAAGDSVIEFASEGVDTVTTGLASYSMSDNVENLTYTGAASFTGIGNGWANIMTGGAGDDFLSAMGGDDIIIGGQGNDLLIGGAGLDDFRYVGNETGMDRILDFTVGNDRIGLSTAGYAPTAFYSYEVGTVATTANSTFLYETATGIVRYDPDGSGSLAAIALAQLNADMSLSRDQFYFY